MQKTVEETRQLLRRMLTDFRYAHSVNVAERAYELAQRYGADGKQAFYAGLVHDICKDMPRGEQLQIIRSSDIILDDVTLAQPQLWHGFAGGIYIQRELDVTDPDIIRAVSYHTSARGGMSRLEQIVYLADLTSCERDYPDVEHMRRTVDESLSAGMREALLYIIGALVAKQAPISPLTCAAYNEYVS